MLAATLHHPLKTFALDVAFEMAGGTLALFGPSGAGKSISLQLIAGLLNPARGRIVINGQVMFDSGRDICRPPQQRQVGYVMQDYALFPHLSVAQNIAYGLRPRRLTATQMRREVARMLDLIQLTGYELYRVQELSGGQRQRVALARALVIQPALLLLDEPFSALDAPTRMQLRQDLRALLDHIGLPTVLVTHDLAEANLLADDMVVMQRGHLLQRGPPLEIMSRPRTLAVARLTGMQNCFLGRLLRCEAAAAKVAVGPLRLHTPPTTLSPGQAIYCCLRPEHVILLRSPMRIQRYKNVVATKIVSQVTDGMSFVLRLQLVGQRLLPEQPHDLVVTLPLHVYEALRPAVGQQWQVGLKQSAIHLIPAAEEY